MADLIPITDPADPRIEAYRDIRERDLVGRQGRFVAEGEVVLRAAIRSGRHALDSLLLADSRANALSDLIAALPAATPVYLAPQTVLDAIAGFHLHRGILGIGGKAADPGAAALLDSLPGPAVIVVACGIGNHDNVGGIFRNAAAFGAGAVLLDQTCCDPYYRKAIRVSVGGVLATPFARLAADEDLIDVLSRAGFEAVALTPGGAEALKTLTPSPRTALILGPEGPGLPTSLLARTRTVRIEMGGNFDSLNVAVASGVALHHMTTHPASVSGVA